MTGVIHVIKLLVLPIELSTVNIIFIILRRNQFLEPVKSPTRISDKHDEGANQ